MNHHKQSLRVGAAAILCALILRLGVGGAFRSLGEFLAQPSISSLLIYLETGRIVRFSPSLDAVPFFASESPPPVFDLPEEAGMPVFASSDGAAASVKYYTSKTVDLEELITRPLSWNLGDGEPRVLILHTHATESYTKASGERYKETAAFRTLDEDYNMISVGDYLTAALENAGIGVIHDRGLHDYPSYNGSYSSARKSIKAYLQEYPTIQLVLDLHRDASGDNSNQLKTSAVVDGEKSAQLMIVVGSDGSGLNHPQWEENFSLALKLYTQLERTSPGICRYISLRGQRFNQDQHTGALLIEVGAAGNSHDEAIRATSVLAKAVIAMAQGVEIA